MTKRIVSKESALNFAKNLAILVLKSSVQFVKFIETNL